MEMRFGCPSQQQWLHFALSIRAGAAFARPFGSKFGEKLMITKKQLGIILVAMGIVGTAAIFAVDVVGAGEFQGIGPAQRVALLAAGAIILLGLTLLPLGDKPA